MTCPYCHADSTPVLYMGLPMRVCVNPEFHHVFSGFAWIMDYVPFNGAFMNAQDGYVKALWRFLWGQS